MSDHEILSNHEILSKHDIIVPTLWKSPLKPNFNLLIITIDDLKQSGFRLPCVSLHNMSPG